MKVAVFATHVANEGGFGGGEHHTAWFISALMQYYDVTVFVEHRKFPRFENFKDDYGIDGLANLKWKYLDTEALQEYDCLVNISHHIKLANPCRLGVLVTFFPNWPWDTQDYDTVICNSRFSQWAVKQRWGRDAVVIYPPIKVADFQPPLPKENIVLQVGRFFDVPSGNTKRHDVVIQAFQQADLPDWELHLVGMVQHKDYYARIRALAGDDSRIVFHHGLNGEDYRALMRRASILASATGYQASDIAACEHRGIIVEEAMASGTVPLVHNSGGMPEGGALVWNAPADFVEQLHTLCNDGQKRQELSEQFLETAQQYDIGAIGPQLVEAIERPLVIPPDPNRRKVWVEHTEKPIKVGMLSDCQDLTTGFGVVTKAVGSRFLKAGFEVAAIGMQDKRGDPRLAVTDPYPIWRANPHAHQGMLWLEQFLQVEKPDVMYVNYDFGSTLNMMSMCREKGYKGPFVIYCPIEGVPMPDEFLKTMLRVKQEGGEVVTYTQWGADLVKRKMGLNIRWAYHGVDHADFRRYPIEERRALRKAVGLDKKFVVMALKRNKRTSNLDQCIYAARKLKAEGITDTIFYLHTNPFEANHFQPVPLERLAHSYGVAEMIWFPPIVFAQEYGVAYDQSVEYAAPDTDSLFEKQRMTFAGYSLADRFNCADVFVAVESVEGFGLPLVEAMACGLPIVSVADGSVRNEVLSKNQPGDVALLIKPAAHGAWHIGSRLQYISYVDLAEVIKRLRTNVRRLREMSAASLARSKDFRWADTADTIIEAVRQAHERTR